eukprot:2793655-Pleurochrysis_carterae.AAC.1
MVLLGRRLPSTASDLFATQCMPAAVFPSHIVLAPDAANAGVECMTEVNISYASASLRTFAKRSLKAASPRVISAIRLKSKLHIASPCGMRCRSSAMRASLALNALQVSVMAWPSLEYPTDFSYASKAPMPTLGRLSRPDPSSACDRPAANAAR